MASVGVILSLTLILVGLLLALGTDFFQGLMCVFLIYLCARAVARF